MGLYHAALDDCLKRDPRMVLRVLNALGFAVAVVDAEPSVKLNPEDDGSSGPIPPPRRTGPNLN
jgi:hypothetical protein